jgi:hypothetical protein
MDPVPPSSPRRRRVYGRLLVIGSVLLLFVFFCSGLHFPFWNARGHLNSRLSDEMQLSLPPSAKVTHAVRVATNDPAEYYAIEMDVADVAPFMAHVRSALPQAREVDPATAWTMGRIPDWWKPSALRQVQRLDGFHRDEQGGYIWYFSKSEPTIYFFWCRT